MNKGLDYMFYSVRAKKGRRMIENGAIVKSVPKILVKYHKVRAARGGITRFTRLASDIKHITERYLKFTGSIRCLFAHFPWQQSGYSCLNESFS